MKPMLKSFRFKAKKASNNEDEGTTLILSALKAHVDTIDKDLREMSGNTKLVFNKKSLQYKSSDEIWKFYKG